MRRILQRDGWGVNRVLEMLLGCRKVMGHRHVGRVTQPLGNNVQRELACQLGFATRSQILEQSLPRIHSRSLQDALKLSPQILAWISVSSDNVNRTLFGSVERGFQVRLQLGEDRNPAMRLALLGGLGRCHLEP
ncbi:MAG: hypothetical protein WD049_09785 [Candidatus Paceibacterota bacterium]